MAKKIHPAIARAYAKLEAAMIATGDADESGDDAAFDKAHAAELRAEKAYRAAVLRHRTR